MHRFHRRKDSRTASPAATTSGREDFAVRLLKGSAKKSYEPIVDIDWDAPLPDD
ncbi:hypothetical protein C6A85_31385, partial [Mycobacterium sp. ITM-2017-0098]